MARIPTGPFVAIVAIPLLITGVFGAGLAAGIYLYPQISAAAREGGGAHDAEHVQEPHAEEHEDHEEHDHVELTRQAFLNLEVRMGGVERRDFWKSRLAPARVVEIPGRSNLLVASPVEGVVDVIHVSPGETLRSHQRLFEIRLTDPLLLDTQSELLATLAKVDVAQQEVARLGPLAATGAISGARKRERELELQQLQSQVRTARQHLETHGLSTQQVDQLVEEKRLLKSVSVTASAFAQLDVSQQAEAGYSIETLAVHPGMSIQRGVELCSVSYHKELYLECSVFEDELNVLQRIQEQGWPLGFQWNRPDPSDGLSSEDASRSLHLLRIDNHVDELRQTVRFYAVLQNQVQRTVKEGERSFQQWLFRPGQRVHVRLPEAVWKNQLVLPRDAVVIDGPNAFVFVEHEHDEHDEHADHDVHDAHSNDDDHEDGSIELEPVAVHVLHRDDQHVVLADDGQLTDEHRIAQNQAYKLYLELKMQSGGGGGHHHHDH